MGVYHQSLFWILLCGAAWISCAVPVASTGWPMWGHDPGMTWDVSNMSSIPKCHPNCEKWKSKYQDAMASGPLMTESRGGRIVLPLWDWKSKYGIGFISSDGTLEHVWQHHMQSSTAEPVLFEDGSFVVCDAVADLVMISSNRSVRWTKHLPRTDDDDNFYTFNNFLTAEPRSGDVLVVLANGDIARYAFEDGALLWHATAFDRHPNQPRIACGITSNNKSIGVFDVGNQIVALSLSDGSEAWRVNIESEVHSIAVRNSRVFVGAEGKTTCLELQSGKEVWTLHESGYALSVTQSHVYIGVNQSGIVADVSEETGKVLWKTNVVVAKNFIFYEGITIFKDAICPGSGQGHLVCFDRQNGTLLFNIRPYVQKTYPPIPGPDGRLVYQGGCIGCGGGGNLQSIDRLDLPVLDNPE